MKMDWLMVKETTDNQPLTSDEILVVDANGPDGCIRCIQGGILLPPLKRLIELRGMKTYGF